MSTIPAGLKYSKTHEWVRHESNGNLTIGITEHAQHLLGDMVFVELPTIDKTFIVGAEMAVVESVKAAADVYAPAAGTIITVNEKLQSQPELVNQDPYGEGWLVQIKPAEIANTLDHLLNATQ